ncbi:MAG: hypothetical protein WCA19_08290 [Candidatus Acidiferrales bacterium]
MIDEKKLEELLLKTLGLLKALDEEFYTLSTDVAALKDTLQAISGKKFLPLFEKYRSKAVQRGASVRADVLQEYVEMIRRVTEISS